MEFSTALNNQPWALSPSKEKGPMLYQGSQNEIRRTKVAGPKTRSLRSRAFSRCCVFPTRLGGGRCRTSGLMAAPHFGHSAVPGGTSTRQREQAGNRPTSFLLSRTRRHRLQAEWDAPCPRGARIAAHSRHLRPHVRAGAGPLRAYLEKIGAASDHAYRSLAG